MLDALADWVGELIGDIFADSLVKWFERRRKVAQPATGLPTALVFDLDGVLVDSRHRSARTIDFRAKERGDVAAYYHSYQEFSRTTHGDEPIPSGVHLGTALVAQYKPDLLVYLTARGEDGRVPTEAWLQQHLPSSLWSDIPHRLLMQPERLRGENGEILDLEPRDVVSYKRSIIRELRQTHRILLAVDDHEGICSMYAAEGITTFQLHIPGVAVFGGDGCESVCR